MTTRKPPALLRANLTVEQMEKGIKRLERVISEIDAFDTTKLRQRWGPEQKALEVTIEGALVSVFGHDTVDYQRYRRAAALDNGPITIMSRYHQSDGASDAREYVSEGKATSLQLLKSAIQWLQEEIGDSVDIETSSPSAKTGPVQSRRIFIVHGHDEGARQTVARFIERIGFDAVILSEQANQGRTIIEKIEANNDVGFAIVLLTPDDVGGKTADSLKSRARQNVMLELGYFIGHLGRPRVCALAKGNLEIPTDFAGVLWEVLDDAGAWKQALARELAAADYGIDWNKVMS